VSGGRQVGSPEHPGALSGRPAAGLCDLGQAVGDRHPRRDRRGRHDRPQRHPPLGHRQRHRPGILGVNFGGWTTTSSCCSTGTPPGVRPRLGRWAPAPPWSATATDWPPARHHCCADHRAEVGSPGGHQDLGRCGA